MATKDVSSEAAALKTNATGIFSTDTPEHGEEMIEQYMTKGTHLEPPMSRREAEAYYQWAFPNLTEQQCQEYAARHERGNRPVR